VKRSKGASKGRSGTDEERNEEEAKDSDDLIEASCLRRAKEASYEMLGS
jgi:hypothetical protein